MLIDSWKAASGGRLPAPKCLERSPIKALNPLVHNQLASMDSSNGAVKSDGNASSATGGIALEELKVRMQEFASARDWEQFHSPRNLLLALVGEVGELSEIFQWKGEVQRGLPDWTSAEKEHLGDELSDVLLYLTRLADVCGVDLSQAVLQKLAKNDKKYPIEKCRGSSNKYTANENYTG